MQAIKPYDPTEFETVATIGATITAPEGKRGTFHVFSDDRDEYFNLDQENEARALFKQWAEVYGCARLYLEIDDIETGDSWLEECWESEGEYPM